MTEYTPMKLGLPDAAPPDFASPSTSRLRCSTVGLAAKCVSALTVAVFALICAGTTVLAEVQREGGLLTASFGPYMYHVSAREKFNDAPWLLGLAWEQPSRFGVGGAFFRNSYDQPCGYVYGQKRFTWSGEEEGLFLKLTLGLLYGYKAPHEHAVPFNYGGFSPGLVPIVGYKSGRATAELVIFGASSGFVAAFGYDLWK